MISESNESTTLVYSGIRLPSEVYFTFLPSPELVDIVGFNLDLCIFDAPSNIPNPMNTPVVIAYIRMLSATSL